MHNTRTVKAQREKLRAEALEAEIKPKALDNLARLLLVMLSRATPALAAQLRRAFSVSYFALLEQTLDEVLRFYRDAVGRVILRDKIEHVFG